MNNMKSIFWFIIMIILLSCNKEVLDDGYSRGGTTPIINDTTNTLINTKWVLTKVVSGFSSEYPNDTIYFINNTEYTVNNRISRNYNLGYISNSNNMNLSLYFFHPFGGSHYSGQIGKYFIDDGEINNIEFKDIQNTSSIRRAWFKKI